MLPVYVVVVLVVVLFLLFLLQFRWWYSASLQNKKKSESRDEADESAEQSKYATIGRWKSLKIVLSMFVNGNVPAYEIMERLSQRLGRNVLFVSLGLAKEAVISVSDLAVAKQVMSAAHWINMFKENYYLFKCTWNKPYGLLFGGGEYWRQGRALTLRILHELKFFKQENLERKVRAEVDQVLENLDEKIKEQGGDKATFSPVHMFQMHALNLVSQAGWSQKYQRDDFFMTHLAPLGNKMNDTFNIGFGILEVFPWLTILPGLTFYGDYKRASDAFIEYFKNVLEKRRQLGEYRTAPKNFTDYFLLEIEKRENPAVINDEAYCVIMRDLVWTGSDTISTALEHGILQIALRQDLQQRVQEEIDEVIGDSRLPEYADRNSMPYTQAVLLEILRYSVPVALTSRSAAVDTKFGDQPVPKGSLCGINLYTIHRSEELWSDPFEFRPERFLSPEGQIINTDKIIPFGFGKRFCIGESVARTFLFIAFVALMQRYNFRMSEQHPPPSLKNLPGISRSPVPYFVTIRRRRCLDA